MPGHVSSYLNDFSIINKTCNLFSRNPPVEFFFFSFNTAVFTASNENA